MVKRATGDDGHEIRVVSLTTFITVTGALLACLGTTAGYAWGGRAMLNNFNDRLDQRYMQARPAEEIHRNLSERITDCNREVGVVRGRFDAYIDAHSRTPIR